MSTYYYFACDNCKEYGGFYSRQAWGWGNADMIASFRFLMHHTSQCGEKSLRVISEHADETLADDWTQIRPADEDELYDRERFDYYHESIWPRSDDWPEGAEKNIQAYLDALDPVAPREDKP